jgi:hypothetical protein
MERSVSGDLIVQLPNTCECGRLAGKIVPTPEPTPKRAANAICTDCGEARFPVSEKTVRFLTDIANMFGAPREIIFRTADAAEKIEQQDFRLKTRYARDGRSHYQIFTDVFDGVESGGDETPDDSGATETVEN